MLLKRGIIVAISRHRRHANGAHPTFSVPIFVQNHLSTRD